TNLSYEAGPDCHGGFSREIGCNDEASGYTHHHDAGAKPMSEQGRPEVNTPKPRLLFVEDEATLREHLAERLSDEYIVDTAGNGNDALLAVMRAKPTLVVTDIVMPDMDGVELLKTLRQSPGTRRIPVLLISGRAPE